MKKTRLPISRVFFYARKRYVLEYPEETTYKGESAITWPGAFLFQPGKPAFNKEKPFDSPNARQAVASLPAQIAKAAPLGAAFAICAG